MPARLLEKKSGGAFTFHPFLLAIYPAVLLYARNVDEATVADVLKPIVACIILAFLLFTLVWTLVRDGQKTGLVSTLVLFPMLTYGHVMSGIRGKTIAGVVITGSVVMPLWALITMVLVVLIWRTRKGLLGVNRFGNVLSLLLVGLSLLQIGTRHWAPNRSASHHWSKYVRQAASSRPLQPPAKEIKPDIYYIILDEYARKDAIQSYFGYDNSLFVDYLIERGFYVAPASTSNYVVTYLSLSSSLNMNYVPTLAREAGVDVEPRLLGHLVRDAKTMHLLKGAGYKFVFFPSGFQVTRARNRNADITMTKPGLRLSEFDRVFVSTTALARFNPAYRDYADNILYTFDQLPKVAEIKEPTFTFAHITMPHMPYLFDARGKRLSNALVDNVVLTKEDYTKYYLGQLIYLNKRMQTVIDEILTKSKTPPIIIVQGDHGMKCNVTHNGTPSYDLKRQILNAYYLPGDGRKLLYPTISPVNTFRVVFNHYLGGDYDLLDDVSYLDKTCDGKITFRRID